MELRCGLMGTGEKVRALMRLGKEAHWSEDKHEPGGDSGGTWSVENERKVGLGKVATLEKAHQKKE